MLSRHLKDSGNHCKRLIIHMTSCARRKGSFPNVGVSVAEEGTAYSSGAEMIPRVFDTIKNGGLMELVKEGRMT